MPSCRVYDVVTTRTRTGSGCRGRGRRAYLRALAAAGALSLAPGPAVATGAAPAPDDYGERLLLDEPGTYTLETDHGGPIVIAASDVVLDGGGNEVRNPGAIGVQVRGSRNTLLDGNELYTNGGYGLSVRESPLTVLECNDFDNNDGGEFRVDPASEATMERASWWSCRTRDDGYEETDR